MTQAIESSPRSLLRVDTSFGLLLVLLLAVLALRVAGLAVSHAELFFDEAQYWAWAQDPAFGYYTKPPLIAWLIGASTALCGDSPACIRLPAPLMHFATALLVYATAARLFDRRVAFWSSLIYAIMPGTSISATLISTDVPLLFFWTLGLLAIVLHVERPSLAAGALLGVAVGLGLNAKYAMAFLLGCFFLYALFTREARALLKQPGTWLAVAIAALLIAPNVWWNMEHSFATFTHTRDNAGAWGSRFPNVLGVFEFIGIQAAIIGPVPFAGFVLVLLGAGGKLAAGPKRLLLFHSLPVFLAIVGQALLNKANGNWAATGFPAAVILATAAMLAFDWRRGMIVTLWISVVALVAVSFAGALAGTLSSGPAGRELGKMVGWGDLAANIRRIAEANGIRTVVLGERGLTASMIYELRDSGLQVKAWRADPDHPLDHFELTRPWGAGDAGPVLFVTMGEAPPPGPLAPRATRLESFSTQVFIARRAGAVASAYRID
ncbi:MAG TPA: glycosyltransferase family 39 protein [Rhizobiaceae bacterium]|nr:glycosyltransferase family 39 protein [Rhizobiaceae bacterium]